MKNIQVIDGAENSEYAIFQVTDEAFALLFPGPGQDIEFIEDAWSRLGEKVASECLGPAWKRKLIKSEAHGIHGTLFYELENKKKFYPNKKTSDLLEYQHLHYEL